MNDNNYYIKFENVTKNYLLKQNFTLKDILFMKKTEKTYKTVIDNLSFSISTGESVGIIGRNGAGKSTILKLITGVCYPTYGNIKIKGNISSLLELKAGFEPELTGYENILLKLDFYRYDRKNYDNTIKKIIDFADIGDYINQPIRTYSTGMRSRLGFAININIKPEILIIDEALSVGDLKFRKKCINKIIELKKTSNMIFLLVSHNENFLKNLCSRGIVLKEGKIVFDGNIDDAINFYNSN